MSPKIRRATIADRNTITTFNVQIALVNTRSRVSLGRFECQNKHTYSTCRGVLQETEDINLDPKIASEGVAALLNDPAKGRYFVLEVGRHIPCHSSHRVAYFIVTQRKSCVHALAAGLVKGDVARWSRHTITHEVPLQEDGQIAAQLMITFEWSDWCAPVVKL